MYLTPTPRVDIYGGTMLNRNLGLFPTTVLWQACLSHQEIWTT